MDWNSNQWSALHRSRINTHSFIVYKCGNKFIRCGPHNTFWKHEGCGMIPLINLIGNQGKKKRQPGKQNSKQLTDGWFKQGYSFNACCDHRSRFSVKNQSGLLFQCMLWSQEQVVKNHPPYIKEKTCFKVNYAIIKCNVYLKKSKRLVMQLCIMIYSTGIRIMWYFAGCIMQINRLQVQTISIQHTV